MMAIPRGLEATVLPDVSVSWSDRNGGELLLIGGSVRMVVSAAWAQALVDKFSKALAVPKRAAEMAGRPPAPEPERVPDAAPEPTEDIRHRKGALIGALPKRADRLAAVRHARAEAGPDPDIVMIHGIAFTAREAAGLEVTLDDEMIAAALAVAAQE